MWNFNHLFSVLRGDGKCDKEIWRCTEIAKDTFQRLKNIRNKEKRLQHLYNVVACVMLVNTEQFCHKIPHGDQNRTEPTCFPDGRIYRAGSAST